MVSPEVHSLLGLDDTLGGMAGSMLNRRIRISADMPEGEYIYVFDAEGKGWALPEGTEVMLPNAINNAPLAARHSSMLPRYGRAPSSGKLRVNGDKTVDVNLDSGHFFRDDPIVPGSGEEKAWLAAITEALSESGLAIRYASSGHGNLP